jgi:hypothetical protein
LCYREAAESPSASEGDLQRTDFMRAAEAGIITRDQAERLAAFFSATGIGAPSAAAAAGPRFDLAHALWYLGALIVMGAMGLFSTLAFGMMGAPALLATAVIYAVGLAAVGHHLWDSRGLRTPGGLLITAAVAMVPLALYAILDMSDWWGGLGRPGTYQGFYKYIKGGWLPIEIGTLAACLIALGFYRFPFIVFVAAVMIWFMSMDVADLLRGQESWTSWELRRNVSLVFGLVMISFAWAVDIWRKDADFGFWLHLVGALTFFGGLSLQDSGSEIGKLVYCLICLGMIGFGVFLSRRVYAVFGGLGLFGYVGHLAWKVFSNVLIFPFVMSAVGIGVIWFGIKFHRNADRISAWFDAKMPDALKRLRPAVRG